MLDLYRKEEKRGEEVRKKEGGGGRRQGTIHFRFMSLRRKYEEVDLK